MSSLLVECALVTGSCKGSEPNRSPWRSSNSNSIACSSNASRSSFSICRSRSAPVRSGWTVPNSCKFLRSRLERISLFTFMDSREFVLASKAVSLVVSDIGTPSKVTPSGLVSSSPDIESFIF